MNIPYKSLSSGFSMPIFGIGTWTMGGKMEHDMHHNKDIAAIQYAINQGITHIDTAEIYAAGGAEKLIGEAIQGTDRSALFLVSKVSPANLSYDDVLRSAEASLQRLQTDYLDLYLIHKPNQVIPIAETMRALNRLKDEGLIKNIGVSNFNVGRMEEAQQVSKHPIVANQLHYNVLVREIEKKGVLKYCQANGVMVIAWRPIGNIPTLVSANIMQELSSKYQKTPIQIAINWLTSQQNVVTLTKTSSPEHLNENLGGIGWEMEGADIERLIQEFPDQIDVSDAAPLV